MLFFLFQNLPFSLSHLLVSWETINKFVDCFFNQAMSLYNIEDSKLLITFLCDSALLQEKEIREMQKKRLHDVKILKSAGNILRIICSIEGFAQPLIEELKAALWAKDIDRLCQLNNIIYAYVVAMRKSQL